MEKSKIKHKLTDMINNIFPYSCIDPGIIEYVDLIDDFGMDSISFISIVIEIETAFDIIVPDEMLLMENFRNVNRIVEIIEKEKNFIANFTNEQEGKQ